jgi:hypothetical protein
MESDVRQMHRGEVKGVKQYRKQIWALQRGRAVSSVSTQSGVMPKHVYHFAPGISGWWQEQENSGRLVVGEYYSLVSFRGGMGERCIDY